MKIKTGIIQSINYENCTVTATFEEDDTYSLEDLQVPQINNRSYLIPKVKDTGIFIFDEDDRGFLMKCVYSESQMPPTDKNDLIVDFEGTILKIDLESKVISIETDLDINAKCNSFSAEAAENITVKAKKIILDGEVESTKSLKIAEDIDAKNINASMNVKASTDVTVGTISLKLHTHTGNMGTPTSPPIGG